jgi:hypothetical protein
MPHLKTDSQITGASRSAFERACYAVHAHGDGTGTVVLDWYETSDGRDFMGSITFMRTEIEAARRIVQLLNANLPGGLPARTEYPPDGEDS